MKKVILTELTYLLPSDGKMEWRGQVTKSKLVVINSSTNADPNDDISAAVNATKKWFEKSSIFEQGAEYISITAEPTIDAENPDPPALYTEANLVSFGNFMAQKILDLELEDYDKTSAEYISKLCVWDSDLANWKESIAMGHRKVPSKYSESVVQSNIRDYEKEKKALQFIEEMCAASLTSDEYEKWNGILNIIRTRRSLS